MVVGFNLNAELFKEQFNVFAGYRFPRRSATITLGLLNLTDQNYRLNPLNLYNELPRERTLLARFQINF